MDDPYIDTIRSLVNRYTDLIQNDYNFIHYPFTLSSSTDHYSSGSNQETDPPQNDVSFKDILTHQANDYLEKYQALLMDMIHAQPFIPTNDVKLLVREAMDYCIQRIPEYHKLLKRLSTSPLHQDVIVLTDMVPWIVPSLVPPDLASVLPTLPSSSLSSTAATSPLSSSAMNETIHYYYGEPAPNEPLRSSRPLPLIPVPPTDSLSSSSLSQNTIQSIIDTQTSVAYDNTSSLPTNRYSRPLPSIPSMPPNNGTNRPDTSSPLPIPAPSESLPSLPETVESKTLRLRGKAIQELIMSERIYLQHLLRLINLFLRPLQEILPSSTTSSRSSNSSPTTTRTPKYEEGFPYTVLLEDLPSSATKTSYPSPSLIPIPSNTSTIPPYTLSSVDHDYLFHHVDNLLPLHCKLLEICGEIIEHKPQGWASSNSKTNPITTSTTGSTTSPNGTIPHSILIGPIFIQFAPFFKLYTEYCYGSSTSLEDLGVWYSTRPQFKTFVTQREQDTNCVGQSLASLLIMPIQRIPRYRLLLTEIRRYTSADHPDYPLLTQAIELIEVAATHLDTNVIKYTNQLRILALQRNLVPPLSPSLIIPSRQLLRYGNYEKLNRSLRLTMYSFFLFNDLLLYTRIPERNVGTNGTSTSNTPTGTLLPSSSTDTTKLYLHGILQIMNVEKYPYNHAYISSDQQRTLVTKYPYALEIQAIPKSIVILFPNEKDRSEWFIDIQRSIERNNQGRRTRNILELHPRYSTPLCILDTSEKRKQCTLCQSSFGITRHRYLCLTCGNQICRSCSYTVPNVVNQYSDTLHRFTWDATKLEEGIGGNGRGSEESFDGDDTDRSRSHSSYPHHHSSSTYSSNLSISRSSMSTRTSSKSTESDDHDTTDGDEKENGTDGATVEKKDPTIRVDHRSTVVSSSWNMFDVPITYHDIPQRIRILTILRSIRMDPTNRLSSYNHQSIRMCEHCVQVLKKTPVNSTLTVPKDQAAVNQRPKSMPTLSAVTKPETDRREEDNVSIASITGNVAQARFPSYSEPVTNIPSIRSPFDETRLINNTKKKMVVVDNERTMDTPTQDVSLPYASSLFVSSSLHSGTGISNKYTVPNVTTTNPSFVHPCPSLPAKITYPIVDTGMNNVQAIHPLRTDSMPSSVNIVSGTKDTSTPTTTMTIPGPSYPSSGTATPAFALLRKGISNTYPPSSLPTVPPSSSISMVDTNVRSSITGTTVTNTPPFPTVSPAVSSGSSVPVSSGSSVPVPSGSSVPVPSGSSVPVSSGSSVPVPSTERQVSPPVLTNTPSIVTTNTMQDAIMKLRKQVETTHSLSTTTTSNNRSSTQPIVSSTMIIKPSVPMYGQPLPVPIPDRHSLPYNIYRTGEGNYSSIGTVPNYPAPSHFSSTSNQSVPRAANLTRTNPGPEPDLLTFPSIVGSSDMTSVPVGSMARPVVPSLQPYPTMIPYSSSSSLSSSSLLPGVLPSTDFVHRPFNPRPVSYPNLVPLPPPQPTVPATYPGSIRSNNRVVPAKIFTDPFADLLPPW